MNLPFVKMHGLGNDYIFLDAIAQPEIEQLDLASITQRVSRRHFNIGSDGVILLAPSRQTGDIRMRIWNADGSEAEMCGNGVRCLARLAVERGYAGDELTIETPAGLRRASIARDDEGGIVGAAIDMGAPTVDVRALPVDLRNFGDPIETSDIGANVYLLGNRPLVFVGVGNPHAVCFLQDDLHRVDLEREGPAIECDQAFPQRINVQFAHIVRPDRIVMRSWERGAGATLACGTGACAVLVAGVVMARTDRRATLSLPGGELDVHWDEASGHVFKVGPAEHVCSGEFPVLATEMATSAASFPG